MHHLNANPITTKAVTSGVICFAGDVNCQMIIHHHNNKSRAVKEDFVLDKVRTCRMAFLGFALIGPVSHVWYGIVNKVIPGTGAIVNLKRVLLDQGFFAPLFISTFFTTAKTLEGNKPAESVQALKDSFLDIYKSNLMLWPAAMLINFSFVPPQFQVLYANAVGLIWNSYMSFMANDNDSSEATERKGEEEKKK
jgi:hypothetical protein